MNNVCDFQVVYMLLLYGKKSFKFFPFYTTNEGKFITHSLVDVLPRTRSRVETNVNMFYSKNQRLNGYLAWPYQLLWIICYGNQRFAQHSNHVNVNECFTAQPETKNPATSNSLPALIIVLTFSAENHPSYSLSAFPPLRSNGCK